MRLFVHVFMRCLCCLIMQKVASIIKSSTLLIMLALCASYLCDECFRFCFMLAVCNIFSLNTFRYKGLLNCAGEHRGELCWESADFRAERPRPALLLLFFSLLKWPSKDKKPQNNEQFPNYFFGGNFAAPGDDFR